MVTAFYAPLKAPDHPVPSGDREMARALFGLLAQAGEAPYLASRLRSFDRDGDAVRQQRLARLATREVARIWRRIAGGTLQRPSLWFTYHGYHKAPDHLGPALARRLDIPYALAESSIAGRRARDRWALGGAATRSALGMADLVLAMTERDARGLHEVLPADRPPLLLRPFIDGALFRPADTVEGATRGACDACRLVTVGMMRDDVKRRSYLFLAEALARCLDLPWELRIVGDGPARGEIERAFATAAPDRVRFLGALARPALPEIHRSADLFVWPALDEAYGLAILEAQACGLPVVVGAAGGVPEIVAAGRTGLLPPPDDAAAFAAALRALIEAPSRRAAMGRAAAAHVAARHSAAAALATLRQGLAIARARHHRRRAGG